MPAGPDLSSKTREGYSFARCLIEEFLEDDCLGMAASLAFYTVFSLPLLMVVLVRVAGLAFGDDAALRELHETIEPILGSESTWQLEVMINHADEQLISGFWNTLLSVGALIFGATGALVQLQKALNRAWEVAPDPSRSVIKDFLSKRLLSFILILGIGGLLIAALFASAVVSAYAGWISAHLPDAIGSSGSKLAVLNGLLSFFFFSFAFSIFFKMLPDARVAWRDVWLGSMLTALLFSASRSLIGLYLQYNLMSAAAGEAGFLVVLLIWVYSSALIFLFGAEFTQVWAHYRGRTIYPSSGAVWVRSTFEFHKSGEPAARVESSDEAA